MIAAANANATPTAESDAPCRTSTISPSPTSASASATQIRRRTGSRRPNRAHSATRSGARYWIRRATPIASRWIARKYSHCTNASPQIPNAARYGSSRRLARSRDGAVTSTISTSPTNAPVERTCASRSDEIPALSITFETTPFTAQSVAAAAAIRYPSRGRR